MMAPESKRAREEDGQPDLDTLVEATLVRIVVSISSPAHSIGIV